MDDVLADMEVALLLMPLPIPPAPLRRQAADDLDSRPTKTSRRERRELENQAAAAALFPVMFLDALGFGWQGASMHYTASGLVDSTR